MSTLSISLPDELDAFVEKQTSERGYDDASDYLSDLVRREQAREHLRALLLEGAASPRGPVADDAYFEERLRRIREHAQR